MRDRYSWLSIPHSHRSLAMTRQQLESAVRAVGVRPEPDDTDWDLVLILKSHGR